MSHDFFRIFMPYVIEKNENGEWLVLNREYSPLGCPDKLDWKLFPDAYQRIKKITDSKIKQLEKTGAVIRVNENGEATRIVLYNDGSVPVNRYDVKLDKLKWNAYCNILEVIATMKTI